MLEHRQVAMKVHHLPAFALKTNVLVDCLQTRREHRKLHLGHLVSVPKLDVQGNPSWLIAIPRNLSQYPCQIRWSESRRDGAIGRVEHGSFRANVSQVNGRDPASICSAPKA